MSKTKDRPLRVLGVAVDNVLRLVSINIRAEGRVVELTGKNRQGKTSIPLCIWMALGGAKNMPEVPLHGEAEAGFIIVELGDDDGLALKVTLRLRRREDGSIATSLTVENADGQKFAKPQEILNALLGSLSVDPLDFMRLDSKRQFDRLKALVPGVDFDATAAANKADFDERTQINRRVKELHAQAGPEPAADAPTQRIDETALIEEMQIAGEHNATIERLKADHAAALREIAAARAQVTALEERANQLRAQAWEADAAAAEMEGVATAIKGRIEAAPALPEPINVTVLRERIQLAKQTNEAVARVERHRQLRAEEVLEQARADAMTKAIEDRNAAKIKAIGAAKMPIDGLTFGEDVVLYRGYPISQASDAEQRRLAILLAAALNPRLRFVHIRDASLLDSDAWADLEKLCEEADIHVWAETVQSGRPAAVVIDDGRVVAKTPALEAAE